MKLLRRLEKLHKSAYISGGKFFSRYATATSASILEIGSYNVNGTLRDFQPKGSNWVGADIESGPGVDLVIDDTSALPFEDSTFDYVIASSVFEHDPTFWSTFSEMVRVLKNGGSIYINSPSNGMIHRYPVDVYRFYPDAGKALEKWGKSIRPELRLAESFIGKHDEEPWNDFCAVFTLGKSPAIQTIFSDTNCENVWHEDTFLENTFAEFPQDQRNVRELQTHNSELQTHNSELQTHNSELQTHNSELQTHNSELQTHNSELQTHNSELQTHNSELQTQLSVVLNSKSWRITKPLREIISRLR
jgi:SAM-dependent methyltransferase